MKFLKGLGTFVCSFLLFLALAIFSLAFVVHGTILNPGFVTKEVNKVEVASILNEAIKMNDGGKNNITPEMKTILVDTATRLEPALKQQLKTAIYTVYDYLKGKRQEPEIATVLTNSIASNDFLVTFINNLDIVSLVKEIISESDSQTIDGFSKELTSSVVDTLTQIEPQLKQEVSAAVAPINDYLWGKTPDLSLADVLGSTILQPDFVESVINEADIAGLTKDYVATQLKDAEQDEPEIVKYINSGMNQIINLMEPWIKQQLIAAINPSVDYILGKSPTVNVTISVAPAVTIVNNVVKVAYLASPPPETVGLSITKMVEYYDTLFNEFSIDLPTSFSFDTELLGPTRDDVSQSLSDGKKQLTEVRNNIAKGLADADEPLAKARKYIGYFQSGYWLLIVFMLVMAGLIFLINRNVKSTSRALGMDLLVFGALDVAGIIVAKLLTPSHFIHNTADVPASALNVIDNVYKDVTNIALRFSIGVLAIGVILLVVSFIMKSRQAEELRV